MRKLGIALVISAISLFVVHGWIILFQPTIFESMQIDRPLHFAGGALVALFAGLVIFSERAFISARSLPWWILLIALVNFSIFIGVLWEFYEFAWDEWMARPFGAAIAQPSLKDTMEDLFFNLAGAVAAGIAFLVFIRPRTNV